MTAVDDIVILIPAYNPDEKLTALVERLRESFAHIVVVDDGSTVGRDIFPKIKDRVDAILVHPVNRGKGAALKTGFAYIRDHFPKARGVVTADADGQHRSEDIIAVARGVVAHPKALVLGVREFAGDVPLRSRFGNFWTRWFFFLMTGLMIRDTQTGLRGIPTGLLGRMLGLEGDRYEYEMRMLADAKYHEVEPVQISIATVYLDANATSHFHPVRDSIRIYWSLFHFCISSVMAFLVDNGVFTLSLYFFYPHFHNSGAHFARTKDVLLAYIVARLVSANLNFFYNRFFVFHSASTKRSFFQYWGVVLTIAALSYFGVMGVSLLFHVRNGLMITVIKIAVETVLFILSYKLQKHWIFRKKKQDVRPE